VVKAIKMQISCDLVSFAPSAPNIAKVETNAVSMMTRTMILSIKIEIKVTNLLSIFQEKVNLVHRFCYVSSPPAPYPGWYP
jgi:hypothetical protein